MLKYMQDDKITEEDKAALTTAKRRLNQALDELSPLLFKKIKKCSKEQLEELLKTFSDEDDSNTLEGAYAPKKPK